MRHRPDFDSRAAREARRTVGGLCGASGRDGARFYTHVITRAAGQPILVMFPPTTAAPGEAHYPLGAASRHAHAPDGVRDPPDGDGPLVPRSASRWARARRAWRRGRQRRPAARAVTPEAGTVRAMAARGAGVCAGGVQLVTPAAGDQRRHGNRLHRAPPGSTRPPGGISFRRPHGKPPHERHLICPFGGPAPGGGWRASPALSALSPGRAALPHSWLRRRVDCLSGGAAGEPGGQR